jgi:hypothetical protein
MRRSLRLIAALLVVGAVGFGASAAMGTTGSSTAGNLSFSITAPDTVSVGQYAAASVTLQNTSQASSLDLQYRITVSGPGVNMSSPWISFHLAPGKSLVRNGMFRVPSRAQSGGQYTSTLSVNVAGAGSGQAAATSTVN